MASEEGRATAEQLVIEGHGPGIVQVLEKLAPPRFIDYVLPEDFPPSAKGTRGSILAVHRALPDLTYWIEVSILGECRVDLRVIGRGTMSGSLFGHPANGREATRTEIHIFNLERGKLIERCTVID